MYIGWYNINCRAKPFEVGRHPDIIDTLGKLVRRLFLFPILFCEVERRGGTKHFDQEGKEGKEE